MKENFGFPQDSRANVAEEEEFFTLPSQRERELLAVRTQDLITEIDQVQADALVYCDQSARPLYILLEEMWRQQKPDLPLPSISFMNLGSETVRAVHKNFKGEIEDLSEIEFASSLGGAEMVRVRKKYQYLRAARSILIVDEYTQSGASLKTAKRCLEVLFPQAEVAAFAYADSSSELFADTWGYPRWKQADQDVLKASANDSHLSNRHFEMLGTSE